MKQLYLTFYFSLFYCSLPAQYFFTGEVKDLHGDKLQNGSIFVQSTGSFYSPGFYGEFEITSRRSEDSLTLSFDGYEPFTTAVKANEYLQVVLKRPSFPDSAKSSHVKCVYTGVKTENSFVDQLGPVSFAANIHRASYGILERFLNMGYTVPAEGVQIEELLNYFNFYHKAPEKGEPFDCSSTLLTCPWNKGHELLCLNICARKIDLQNVPRGNLVLLIDASGSMDVPNKLPIIKSGIRLLIDNLRNSDALSLIAFGGRVRTLLEGVPGTEKARIIKALQALSPDGSTPGEEAIKLAYEVARRQFIPGGNNRIVLITDGDISKEPATEKELEDLVAAHSLEGISFNCIGVGMSKDKGSQLPMLAQKGHGDFAGAGDEQDAEGLLANQLGRTSLAVADGVTVTTDFDTALVKEYRLIGYDSKQSAAEDTAFRLEGSKACSGHAILALFELIPKKDSTGRDTVAGVAIHYSLPGQKNGKRASYYCPNTLIPFDRAENGVKKAVCIAMLGMKLRDTTNVAQISWPDIEKMAKKNFSVNDCMDKEFLALVAKAKRVYTQGNVAKY